MGLHLVIMNGAVLVPPGWRWAAVLPGNDANNEDPDQLEFDILIDVLRKLGQHLPPLLFPEDLPPSLADVGPWSAEQGQQLKNRLLIANNEDTRSRRQLQLLQKTVWRCATPATISHYLDLIGSLSTARLQGVTR